MPVRVTIQVIQQRLSEEQDIVIAAEHFFFELLTRSGNINNEINAYGSPLFLQFLGDIFVGDGQ